MRIVAWFAVGLLLACSSKEPPLPPERGGCVPGAPCANPSTGGGGAATIGADSSLPADGGGSEAGMGTCGTADLLIMPTNDSCSSCAQMTCCAEDSACSGACASLLQCIQACQPGDSFCIGTCENNLPTGVMPYQLFAQCLKSCVQCPTLPTQ